METILNFNNDCIDKEVAEKLSKEVSSYIIEQLKNNMKTIEERAKLAMEGYADDVFSAGIYEGYAEGATEQKAIDIEKACKVFCHTGCPHKRDSCDCLKDKCDTWKTFRRLMEE